MYVDRCLVTIIIVPRTDILLVNDSQTSITIGLYTLLIIRKCCTCAQIIVTIWLWFTVLLRSILAMYTGLHLTHFTSQAFHISNILHLKHFTSETFHISNVSHLKRFTSQTFYISNVSHLKRFTSQTFHISNVLHLKHFTSQSSLRALMWCAGVGDGSYKPFTLSSHDLLLHVCMM